ncbi:MAG: Ig-like domain-containing protein [bacterium]
MTGRTFHLGKVHLGVMFYLLLSCICVWLYSAGCGSPGGKDVSAGDIVSGGRVTVKVCWPDQSNDPKILPQTAVIVEINICEPGTTTPVVPVVRVSRPAGQSQVSVLIAGIPIGPKRLAIYAYDANNSIVAYSYTDITIAAGDNPPVESSLTPGSPFGPTPTPSETPTPTPTATPTETPTPTPTSTPTPTPTPTSTPTLQSISISPASAEVGPGYSVQFTATGHYSDGTTHNITSQVTWNSSNPNAGNMGNDGKFTGKSDFSGTEITNITATKNSLTSNTAVVTVRGGQTDIIIR